MLGWYGILEGLGAASSFQPISSQLPQAILLKVLATQHAEGKPPTSALTTEPIKDPLAEVGIRSLGGSSHFYLSPLGIGS